MQTSVSGSQFFGFNVKEIEGKMRFYLEIECEVLYWGSVMFEVIFRGIKFQAKLN